MGEEKKKFSLPEGKKLAEKIKNNTQAVKEKLAKAETAEEKAAEKKISPKKAAQKKAAPEPKTQKRTAAPEAAAKQAAPRSAAPEYTAPRSADEAAYLARKQRREERQRQRRKQLFMMRCVVIGVAVIVLIGILAIVSKLTSTPGTSKPKPKKPSAQTTVVETEVMTESQTEKMSKAIDAASLMAAQYDYDGAMKLLQNTDGYNESQELQDLAAKFQTQKDACVPCEPDTITHVFFHSLVVDDAKAFDGDQYEGGYNQVMTTVSEFNSMMDQMYERGYVMVSMHDMCDIAEDGTVTKKNIMLPEGKTPFVLSEDDVSYYHYMDGDGFPQKLIVDENGEVKNSYLEDDGSISIGDYDMVPLIDTFVKKHPDFSYHGHKGIVALTGYEGVLGYRTDEVYKTRQADRITVFQQQFFDANPDFDYDKEVREATKVATAMRENGWEFASHTWGHINPQAYGYDSTARDTQRWDEFVKPIVGDTDVLIFAFGADIADWHPYTMDNPFFKLYTDYGFRIFCNVDSSQYWTQFGDNYMRQARRNLDGYRMYYNPEMLEDLFDVNEAWDDNRPVPVPAI